MKELRVGAKGPQVELLQLSLQRAGFLEEAPDGLFGEKTRTAVLQFQKENGLKPDGIVGTKTQHALEPWLFGYRMHRVESGDTLFRLAQQTGIRTAAIQTANPDVKPENLKIGSRLILPLDFPVVPTNIRFGPAALSCCLTGLLARYPFLSSRFFGKTVMGKGIPYLKIGTGPSVALYNAAHHANEWITTPLLLRFLEDYARSYAEGGSIGGYEAKQLFEKTTLVLVPMLDIDGVSLVTGELDGGVWFQNAKAIAAEYPSIPFPSGWKANLCGTDLNLQYPAGWETAKEIKYEQGYLSPAPRDFVGVSPLSAPESRAMAALTEELSPDLTISYHSQGEVIYWRFQEQAPEGARAIAETFSSLTGYALGDAPYGSSFAGYKDWFLQDFGRPGFTFEVGHGENPLPIAQLDEIYKANAAAMAYGLLAAADGKTP